MVNLFLFYSFSFVSVSWLFYRYSFMIMTSDYKLIMVAFDGAEKVDFAISVWTRDDIVSVCSVLAHYRTWVPMNQCKW